MIDNPISTNPPQQPQSGAPASPQGTQQTANRNPAADDFSTRFANLAHREKTLVQREQQLKQLEQKYGKFAELERDKNPHKILETFGLTYNDATKYYLGQGNSSGNGQQTELEKRLEMLENQQKSQITQQQRDATLQDISSYLETQSEKYPLLKSRNGAEDIVTLMEAYYDSTSKNGQPRMLSIDEAAQLVEEEMRSQLQQTLKAARGQDWFQQLMNGEDNDSPPAGNGPTAMGSYSVGATPPPQSLPRNYEPQRRKSDQELREESLEELRRIMKTQGMASTNDFIV